MSKPTALIVFVICVLTVVLLYLTDAVPFNGQTVTLQCAAWVGGALLVALARDEYRR